jgi:2-isopropylmalate synthase
LGLQKKYFDLVGFRIISEKRKEDETPLAEATIMIQVGGKIEHTAALGNGPVNALDNAVRKALEKMQRGIVKEKGKTTLEKWFG